MLVGFHQAGEVNLDVKVAAEKGGDVRSNYGCSKRNQAAWQGVSSSLCHPHQPP